MIVDNLTIASAMTILSGFPTSISFDNLTIKKFRIVKQNLNAP